ncbi:MAG: ABC transporter substrate-binding protein [Candidatus Gracilibacteria bacterium]|jgi:NitT/TauT family transport system substrate-binding protein|nr:ABC transporter substrate-binding protein [Candidatus Gracilibacteria bacterium]
MKNIKKTSTIYLFLAILTLSSCTNINYEKKTDNIQKIKVQAGWLLNGEFANICSAITEGFYENEGLDVELIPGGPSGAMNIIPSTVIAQDNSILIGIENDLIPIVRGITKENESEKLKIKAFATFWNDNPYGFIVNKDSGIKSLKDFSLTKPNGNKIKIGVTAESVAPNAIAKTIGIDVKDLNLSIVGYDATPFLTGQVDALAAYWTTQVYEVEKAGIKYDFLPASELEAFNQPSMVAIATDSTLKNNKQTLVKWLKATVKGTEFVIKNPEKAAKNILDNRCGGNKFIYEQELWLINRSIPLFESKQIGKFNKTQVLNFLNAYYQLDQIPYIPQYEEIVDTSILESM